MLRQTTFCLNCQALQGLVALTVALAELDESHADAQCLQALSLAAERLSALLRAGAPIPSHLLCQVKCH